MGEAVTLSLSRYQKEYWSIRSTYISLFCFHLGLLGAPFIENIYASTAKPSYTIVAIVHLNSLLVLLPALFNCIRWVIIVYFRMHEWRRFLMLPPQKKDGEIATSNNHDHTFYPMIYNLVESL